MVIQNISSDGKPSDLTFLIIKRDDLKTLEIIKSNKKLNLKTLLKMIRFQKFL